MERAVNTNRPVRFSIAWSTRPPNPYSAVLTLTGTGVSPNVVSTEVDSPGNSTSQLQTYTLPNSVKPGTYFLTVEFHTLLGGMGAVEATGYAPVTILPNGSGIGTISWGNLVATVSVIPGQIAFTPQSTQLMFSARDSRGDILAFPPAAGTWSQVDGASNMNILPGGLAIGLQRGSSNVTVTVDGVTSPVASIETTANPNGAVTVLNFDDLPAMPTQFSGTPIPPANRLSDYYLNSDGITFASLAPYVAVVTMPIGTAPSPPNCIASSSVDGIIQYGRATPVTFTFYDPLNPTAPGVTKSFSLTGDLDGRSSNMVELDAYDVSGNLVGQVTTADVGGEVMTIALPSAIIHSVVFLGAPGTNDGVGLDNVTFGPVIPFGR